MKNTAKVKRYYAMSLVDGRIVIATKELLTNPDYRIIGENLAREIESGKKEWKTVAFELRQRDNLNPQALLLRANQEKVKNLRPSPVTRENVEQFETDISEEEVGEIYEGDEADGDGGEGNGKPAPKNKPGKTKEAEETAGEDAADGDGGEGTEDAPEDLDI